MDVPRDRAARPSLDQVLALRADRMATVRGVLAGLTDAALAGMTEPVTEPGYPEPDSYPVRRCLQAILTEEWEHRLYAERDLDLLDPGNRRGLRPRGRIPGARQDPAGERMDQGVGSETAAPKMSELPNVAGQSGCGAGLVTDVPVRRDSRHASMAGQSAPLRTSFQTPTAPVRVAAVYT